MIIKNNCSTLSRLTQIADDELKESGISEDFSKAVDKGVNNYFSKYHCLLLECVLYYGRNQFKGIDHER